MCVCPNIHGNIIINCCRNKPHPSCVRIINYCVVSGKQISVNFRKFLNVIFVTMRGCGGVAQLIFHDWPNNLNCKYKNKMKCSHKKKTMMNFIDRCRATVYFHTCFFTSIFFFFLVKKRKSFSNKQFIIMYLLIYI